MSADTGAQKRRTRVYLCTVAVRRTRRAVPLWLMRLLNGNHWRLSDQSASEIEMAVLVAFCFPFRMDEQVGGILTEAVRGSVHRITEPYRPKFRRSKAIETGHDGRPRCH
jgi:hypothetical protein